MGALQRRPPICDPAALAFSNSAQKALPRPAFLGRRHSGRFRHRLGLCQAELGHVGPHHIAGDMRMGLSGGGMIAVGTIAVVTIGVAAALVVARTFAMTKGAALIVALVRLVIALVRLVIVVVRLGHDRR